MARQFWLENDIGLSFNLTRTIKNFLHNPAGLGFSISSELLNLNRVQYSYSDNNDFNKLSGEVIFQNYEDYHYFVQYIFSSKALRFCYMPSEKVGVHYIYCKVSVLDKMEIDKGDSLLHCNINITPLSMWISEKIYTYNATMSNPDITETYPYTYKYTYGYSTTTIGTGSLEIENNGHVSAPVGLRIKGYSNKPEWFFDDTDPVKRGGINFTIGKGDILIVEARDLQMKTYITENVSLDAFLFHNSRNYLTAEVGKSKLNLKNIRDCEVIIYEYKYTV